MPPARPPNLLAKDRCLHSTNSAQQLQWRELHKKKHPYFLPIRYCSTQVLLVQPYLHMSPKSREESLSDRTAVSSAMCRPIKADAFTVAAGTQGPKLTNSLRTVGSFFRGKKKKSSPCGPYAVPRVQMEPNALPGRLLPSKLEKACAYITAKHPFNSLNQPKNSRPRSV